MPTLRTLGPPTAPSAESESSSNPHSTKITPQPDILAVLLAHIFDNNYSLLSIFKDGEEADKALSEDTLGDVRLRWGGALKALWAYLWGSRGPSESTKGKERAQDTERQFTQVASGQLENADPQHREMIETTFRLLLLACQRSPTNLFIIMDKMPFLQEFLLCRLYGFVPSRRYAETFPARRDWIDRMEDDEDMAKPEWREAPTSLRVIYLALLKKVLETGVDPKTTWRLFSLVKTSESVRRLKDESANQSGAQTPTPQPTTRPTTPVARTDTGSPGEHQDTPRARSRKRPHLTIPGTATTPVIDIERLDLEVLDLIKHAMRSRWPNMFVFRGGRGMSESGIELNDMGRAWPTAQKGFNFSVSHMYSPGHSTEAYS